MAGFTYFINKIEFERLPKPYDTNCQEYGTSNRFQCLNNCFKINYHHLYGCIPQLHSLYTYIMDDNIKYMTFCNDAFLNNLTWTNLNAEFSCKEQCRTPCNEFSYELDILKNEFDSWHNIMPSYYIALNDYYTKIKYSPSLELGNLIINLTNIWSLWHGMSFITIVFEFFGLLKKISSKLRLGWSIHFIHIIKLFQKSNFHKHLKVMHDINFFVPTLKI